MNEPEFDLFISYRRHDAASVLPLEAALRARGLRVWFDQAAISEFDPITDEIRLGLAQSKALLAWFSETYPTSRPCQMELTAAFLAAQHEGDPRQRVLVINPEPAGGHIQPVTLRDAQYAAAPVDATGCAALAERIATHVAKLPGPLGGILPAVPPAQYGLTLTGGNRFVGRLPDLWRLHSALHERERHHHCDECGRACHRERLRRRRQVPLAEEYALRFGAAYPGGVFWLRARADETTKDSRAAVSEPDIAIRCG